MKKIKRIIKDMIGKNMTMFNKPLHILTPQIARTPITMPKPTPIQIPKPIIPMPQKTMPNILSGRK